eukprot:superscaffoldBa00002957_g15742
MDHLLMLLVLLWNSGSQCESTAKADIVLLLVNVYKDIHRLVQYMNHPWTEWFLNTHETKESLLEAVTKLQPREGHFLLGNSLRYILNELFSPTMGMRTDSKKIAILITNGESQDDTCFSSQHLKDTGIEIYTIGVGNANETQLRAIASDPDEIYMYSVSNFSFLLDIIDNLTINLCNNALDPTLHIIRDPDESYSRKVHIIRLVVLPVTLLLVVAVVVFILKASRGQRSDPQENIELDSYNLSVYRAEGESAEEEGAQGAE